MVYGGFDRETGSLCAYARLRREGLYADFSVMKVIPACERRGVNAAMVSGILADLHGFLTQGGYICDGSRSVNHETAFQDYLEKYFGFRKAYCRLHVRYKWWLALMVKCLYPFRELLAKIDKISIIHLVNGVLKMEEYTAERERKV